MGIGNMIIGIGMIHTIFGFVVFHSVWADLLKAGLFNTVGEDPLRGAVVWFGLFALPVFAFGHLVRYLEKSGAALPGLIKWHLLAIMITGIVLIPESGFWLLLVPLGMLWWRKRRAAHAIQTRTETQAS